MAAEKSPSPRAREGRKNAERRGRFMAALLRPCVNFLVSKSADGTTRAFEKAEKSPAETYDPALASTRAALRGESRALWEVTGIQSSADARWSDGEFKSAHE